MIFIMKYFIFPLLILISMLSIVHADEANIL